MIEWFIAIATGAYGFQKASYLGAFSGFAVAVCVIKSVKIGIGWSYNFGMPFESVRQLQRWRGTICLTATVIGAFLGRWHWSWLVASLAYSQRQSYSFRSTLNGLYL